MKANGTHKMPKGTLIIIGGHEDKERDSDILTEVARRANRNRHLLIVTVATNLPEEVAKEYMSVFKRLGASHVHHLDIRTRDEAFNASKIELCKKADVIFFTGGDQLRITSQIGDSPLFQSMHDLYWEGGTIVGTSAGAAAMSATMLVSGENDKSSVLFELGMAPGLDFLHDAVVDSHFAERGRIGRLLGAVAQNPRMVGLGIDEDTAIIVGPDGVFRVLGSGAVYVVDGTDITYSNLSEKRHDGTLTAFDVKLHVLGDKGQFDLNTRRPILNNEEVPKVLDPIE